MEETVNPHTSTVLDGWTLTLTKDGIHRTEPQNIAGEIHSGEVLRGEVLYVIVLYGSAGRTRTYNPSVNSRMLCH
jgi:hypothetical protein